MLWIDVKTAASTFFSVIKDLNLTIISDNFQTESYNLRFVNRLSNSLSEKSLGAFAPF